MDFRDKGEGMEVLGAKIIGLECVGKDEGGRERYIRRERTRERKEGVRVVEARLS